MHFHSDGSVEDWGYSIKFEAAFPPISGDGIKSIHWLDQLSRQMIGCITLISKGLINDGDWDETIETQSNIAHMQTLIKPSMFAPLPIESRSAEEALLYDLIENPDKDEPKALLSIMNNFNSNSSNEEINAKKGVVDLECEQVISKAVRAAKSALIKTNKLQAEAFALASGRRRSPSQVFQKAWRIGDQQLNGYFSYSDAKVKKNIYIYIVNITSF